VETWTEADVVLRAAFWDDLALPDAAGEGATLTVAALDDPRYHDPLLLGSSLPLSAPALRAFSADRWPVEQLPLAAKQMRERCPRVRSRSPDLPAST